mmetsp:Transcript_165207/g.530239  ORF Transcript_165207/g.530239 Transcript_165207/m.530239 type:complete len:95 (+) Transcript_165207:732-1016(+)
MHHEIRLMQCWHLSDSSTQRGTAESTSRPRSSALLCSFIFASSQDLRRIVADLGLEDHLPEEDLDRMVQFFDRNGDGEVDEEDFLRMLSGTSFQ